MKKLPDHIYKSNIWTREPHVTIKGIYPLSLDTRITECLGKTKRENTEYFFLSGIDLEMELDQIFDVLFDINDIDNYINVKCNITHVTQQYGKPFDFFPKGWSVICAIYFPDGIPNTLKKCPVIKSWDDSNSVNIILSNYTFWNGLRQGLK